MILNDMMCNLLLKMCMNVQLVFYFYLLHFALCIPSLCKAICNLYNQTSFQIFIVGKRWKFKIKTENYDFADVSYWLRNHKWYCSYCYKWFCVEFIAAKQIDDRNVLGGYKYNFSIQWNTFFVIPTLRHRSTLLWL